MLRTILVLNAGSSSVKYALFNAATFERKLTGKVEFSGSYKAAVTPLIRNLSQKIDFSALDGIGHRIVYGMQHSKPEQVTIPLIRQLSRFVDFDPAHLPQELELVKFFHRNYQQIPQVACFDTAFHRSMPRVARLLPIPERYLSKGVERYGFHGLSYAFLMEKLADIAGPQAAQGKIILAHLGNGASMTAVYRGKSIDTSMGFTPASGFPMATRSGDVDPGLAWYLLKHKKLSPDKMSEILTHESGVAAVSRLSGDMRILLKSRAKNAHAREAVNLFCYQIRKWIGSFAAVLGGVDTLIFSGGIGENAPVVRRLICENLAFLGIILDSARNAKSAPVISTKSSQVTVRVIPTDEESYIARRVAEFIAK